MGNLTPTVIADKNGKITTVHKKIETSPTSAKALPAPVLSQPKPVAEPIEIEVYDETIGKRLYALMEEANGRELGMDKWVLFSRADNKQMALYADLLERRDGFWDIIAAATAGSLSARDRPGDSELESIALIYDKDAFTEFPNEPKARKSRKQFLKMSSYRDVLMGAHREAAIKGISTRKESFNLGALSPETVEEVRSYVRLLSAAQDEFPEKDLYLGELLDVALHSGHSVDEVISAVREHHTIDANTVLGIINGSSPAVAKGWL